VERRELRFRPTGEKHVFKLHLQVWDNNVLMIMGLQDYKTTGDALREYCNDL
jgi:hypothetical protein